jgi:hypothetical protein
MSTPGRHDPRNAGRRDRSDNGEALMREADVANGEGDPGERDEHDDGDGFRNDHDDAKQQGAAGAARDPLGHR